MEEFLTFFLQFVWEIMVGIYRFFIPKPMKSVKNEIVMITGAGHGIGRELALNYSALGAIVVCVDINEAGNKETADEIMKQHHKRAFTYTCDVTNRDLVIETVQKIVHEIGDITILINNAGILNARPFLQHTTDDIKSTIDVNVMSHFWTLQAVLPIMIKNNQGHVVALSSGCGLIGTVNLVPYATSKFAVRGMMDALLRECYRYNYNIKFTTIYPMIVNTGLCKRYSLKYPLLTRVLSTERAAKAIIKAQRTETEEASIPSSLYYQLTYLKSLPPKAYTLLMDLFGPTLE